MKTLISKLLIALAVFGLVGVTALPASVAAQTKDDICKGINFTTGKTGEDCDPKTTDAEGNQVGAEHRVAHLVQTVINILSWIVGIAAVIMIIIGGFKYILSSGDASNISSAKNTILYAIIGLVIVALAQVIVRFVLITV